jgi:hypothetical protein
VVQAYPLPSNLMGPVFWNSQCGGITCARRCCPATYSAACHANQRRTTSPQCAARYFDINGDIDVTELLSKDFCGRCHDDRGGRSVPRADLEPIRARRSAKLPTPTAAQRCQKLIDYRLDDEVLY